MNGWIARGKYFQNFCITVICEPIFHEKVYFHIHSFERVLKDYKNIRTHKKKNVKLGMRRPLLSCQIMVAIYNIGFWFWLY